MNLVVYQMTNHIQLAMVPKKERGMILPPCGMETHQPVQMVAVCPA
jgi:hypothetical protein